MTGTLNRLRELIHHDAAPGVLLVAAAALAMILDNSPLAWLYDGLLETPVTVRIGALVVDKPLLLWINDGLMAVFFFLVGLEIKREVLEGQLSSVDRALLPAIAAVGGMALPALIYVGVSSSDPTAIDGWAIPAATDIAFALGILSLLGNRVPVALKVFLLAVAIIDDLGAILIIAFFYTADLSVEALGIAATATVVLIAMNRFGVLKTAPYLIIGLILWVSVLKSGVHATLAGVVIALCIPLNPPKGSDAKTPFHDLEHGLHPWVAFMVMPLFAFANSGVPLGGLGFDDVFSPIAMGIALGLFIGKQIGVFGFSYLAVKAKICRLPEGIGWAHMYGIACITGIGFTMSLFIGTLAFSDPLHATQVRLGVLSGSFMSAVLGVILLLRAGNPAVQSAKGLAGAKS